VPEESDTPILVWGGASSVGLYAVQLFKFYGYKNIIVTASSRHHDMIRELGATATIDYNSDNVVEQIIDTAGGQIKYVLDCIGSLKGSIEPISVLAKAGSIVAIALPVVLRDATNEVEPLYEMAAEKVANWNEGVEVIGTRTHFYTRVGAIHSIQMPTADIITECIPR
jgi:NADPH:quinone reductase-like Zn-dependent oxidoreductase